VYEHIDFINLLLTINLKHSHVYIDPYISNGIVIAISRVIFIIIRYYQNYHIHLYYIITHTTTVT